MRFYDILITNADGSTFRHWTSLLPNGQPNPAALQVELDVSVYRLATPRGAGLVKIWNTGLRDYTQQTDFNGKLITVSAGMSKGLPLANPAQAGPIVQGVIRQCFGIWSGTEQNVSFMVTAGQTQADAHVDLSFSWKAGTSLATAIQGTLLAAFPSYTIKAAISPNLVLSHDEAGYYESLTEFAHYIAGVSQPILGGSYPGVDISLLGKAFTVDDGTVKPTPKVIAFSDLVGQPTWNSANTLQFTAVMRSDISVGTWLTLPNTVVGYTAQSQTQYQNRSGFQGTFRVREVRHVGNLRQPDGGSWVTNVDCYVATPPT